ncbi:hypothetical protein BGI41_06845 [Methanobrevibacter sp. 87.7]|uniref:hypothetical protein n=1 Tax=Methanobrevibacter sp. 87.7 TaxID=387957 RepID=UPI000B50DE36|nr:hypothetical protein [Methanobrevibacter sp. 87.7]OWT32596.1 hypothetical protein BGI41_06845 [Methanobrevibacter sp. 87.7]
MEINIEKWNKWANDSKFLFTGINLNRKIAFLIDTNENELIILKKGQNEINVSLLTNVKEVDEKTADILFEIKEEDVEKILNDKNFSKFLELTNKNEIKIYDLAGVKKLIKEGYEAFLSRIGININNTASSSCCCC